MSCCRCIKRLEHVEKVIETYDPNENFVNYDLLTVWVNKKTKKAFILVSKENGIATWVPINADITTIDKIILNCGEVEANENNEIIHTGECGARTVTDNCKDLCITINTEWGLKGGGNVCAGEKLTLSIDLANTTLVISSVKDVQDGDLVVFDGTSGKVITKSNINSVEGLIKIVRSTKGEQKFLVETTDSEAGSDAAIEAKCTGIGYPYFQLTSDETKWRDTVNPVTKNRTIFPIIDGVSKNPILTMLPNGVMLMPWQPKATAKLGRTPNFPANTELELGSNLSFTKIRDEDGYNTSANNFFVGSAGKRAYYKAPYKGSYFVKYQFLLDTGETTATNIPAYAKIFWGKDAGIEFSAYNRNRFSVASFITFTDSGIIFLEKDDIIHININVQGGNPYITVRDESKKAIENYWEVIFIG